MQTSTSFAALIVSLLASAAALRAGDPPVPFQPDNPLQLVINDQVHPRAGDGWTTPGFETDRFATFSDVIEKQLAEAGVTGAITFERWARNLPDASQRLEINLLRWEISPMSFGPSITVECSFWAVLHAGGEKFDMGIFTGQESHLRMRPELYDEDFRPAAEEAVENMIELYSATVRGENFRKR